MASPVNKLPPIHPGELLREDMEALGLSARALAEAIAVPHNRIAVLRGERSDIPFKSTATSTRTSRRCSCQPWAWVRG